MECFAAEEGTSHESNIENMTQEEKARAYDNALKVIEKYKDANIMFTQDLKEEMFPELKENEDGNMRKFCISVIKRYATATKWEREKAIAWLEKQGEQKPAEGGFVNVDDVREGFVSEVYRILDADTTNDRANQIIDAFDSLPTELVHNTARLIKLPKFNAGDWIITDGGGIMQIIEVGTTYYKIKSECGFEDNRFVSDIDCISHLYEKPAKVVHQNDETPIVSIVEQDGQKGVRLCVGDVDIFIEAHDLDNGREFEWKEAMDYLKKAGATTFTNKQIHLVCAFIDTINAKLREIGGEELKGYYWSSTGHNSSYAWGVHFSSGYIDGIGKYYTYVVRPVAAFKK